MAFNPIIRIKRGNGIPSSLVEGELAFDMENDILRIGSFTDSTEEISQIKEIGGEGKFTTLDTAQTITGEKSFERLNLVSNTDNTYLKIDGNDVVPFVLDDVLTQPLTAQDLDILHRTSSVLEKFDGKSSLVSADIDAISSIGTLGVATEGKVLTVDGNLNVENIENIGAASITLTGNKFTIGGTTDSDELNFNITGTTNLTLPISGTVATTSNKLNVFAGTSSSELAGVISDETGSGALVFATSPTLVTPVLGAATATSINKVTITSPADAATLTLSNNSSLITSGGHSLTLTTTGATNVTLPTTGTLATTSNKLNSFSSTTSSELAGVISDETGSGSLVFATSPTLVTPTIGAATATSINKVTITSPADAATLTLSNNSSLITSGGHSLTLTTTGATNVTLPTTGTLITAASLPTVNNGTLTLGVSGSGLSGSASFTANQSGSSTFTVASNGTSANTENTLVFRGTGGDFSAGTITASLTGTATNATNINTADRKTNESGHLVFIGTTATGNVKPYTNTNIRVNPSLPRLTLSDPSDGFTPTSITYGSSSIIVGDTSQYHTLKIESENTVIVGTTYQTTLKVNGSITGNNTVTFPTGTGTLALTSQIPTVITSLSGLNDVSFSNLEVGNLLVYSGTEGWTNSNIIDGGTFS